MTDRLQPRISVVVPAFNEADGIEPLLKRLLPVLRMHGTFEVLFVDDGSTDRTLEVVKRQRALHPEVAYLSFSRNFGHQAALRAGLAHARGECAISLDADLQHPPELLHELIARWELGDEVVYTIREDGPELGWTKRTTSRLFYRAMKALSGVPLREGTADFRLLSRPVLDVVNALEENPLFLRGMLAWLGFRQGAVRYTPEPRRSGLSKYTFGRMVRLALEGITSFSVRPLNLALAASAAVAALACAYSAYAIYMRAFTDQTVPGWTSVLAAVLWLGAVQLLVLGILGEYVGRMFVEAKRRPPFVIRESSRQEQDARIGVAARPLEAGLVPRAR
jgi:dolichol-phosphate mannosyltransferase